ncbi:hypothetical protein AB0758_45860 [Tolypothrix bouteillei VB521301_2]|uniref:hypothetical protein n=1 Tax=Tolypothrix bouteillei TaxID=1246981 RepID=UPI0038B4B3E9
MGKSLETANLAMARVPITVSSIAGATVYTLRLTGALQFLELEALDQMFQSASFGTRRPPDCPS